MKNNEGYVAINYIDCQEDYKSRFEELFSTTKRAIDEMPGFRFMRVLKPENNEGSYLIVSFWDSREAFENWKGSEAFLEGHKRGFQDVIDAKRQGKEAPMTSDFKTYIVLTD